MNAARASAEAATREILSEPPLKDVARRDHQFVITDADGRTVMVVPFKEAFGAKRSSRRELTGLAGLLHMSQRT